MSKPKVLILGGCGFIGRNLVQYLVENMLVSKIIVVDKTMPQTSWMNKNHLALFEDAIVEYRSANLISMVSVERAFADTDGFEFVINLAAETRTGQFEQVYEEGIYKLSTNCARLAAQMPNLRRFIELSTVMNSSAKEPLAEDCKAEPLTVISRNKLKVENELKDILGNRFTVIRLPIVYGPGDKSGMTPRIVIAAVYKYLESTMKLLWTKDLVVNTVHVKDVSSAIWFLANHGNCAGQVINVVDESRSTQGSITDVLCDIFGIDSDYLGSILSKLAKLDLDAAVKDINDEHLQPWAKLCAENGIENTPLTPYIDVELLSDKHLNLSNAKLKSLGFQFMNPKLNRELIEEIVVDYVEQGLFPRSVYTI